MTEYRIIRTTTINAVICSELSIAFQGIEELDTLIAEACLSWLEGAWPRCLVLGASVRCRTD